LSRQAYYALVRLPQFLLVDDSDIDVQAFIAMVRRIGLVNTVRPLRAVSEAKQYLSTCTPAALPVVVFSGVAAPDDAGSELFAWMEEQDPPVSAIPTLALPKPLEMYAVIGALKTLQLPERARIDSTTLTVRVELWPHGTVVGDL
jgi:hypothetical protein